MGKQVVIAVFIVVLLIGLYLFKSRYEKLKSKINRKLKKIREIKEEIKSLAYDDVNEYLDDKENDLTDLLTN
jgi:N-glycosylase/DNA lyase